MPVKSTQECARGHHPAEDMGVKGESGITVHNGIQNLSTKSCDIKKIRGVQVENRLLSLQ